MDKIPLDAEVSPSKTLSVSGPSVLPIKNTPQKHETHWKMASWYVCCFGMKHINMTFESTVF